MEILSPLLRPIILVFYKLQLTSCQNFFRVTHSGGVVRIMYTKNSLFLANNFCISEAVQSEY